MGIFLQILGENPVREVAGGIVDRVFSGFLWFGVALVIICILSFTIWYFVLYRKKFDIAVQITSERSGDRNRVLYDKAAILYDRKTKSKYFRIWGLGVDLPVPKFNLLQLTNRGDLLQIYRTTDEDFYYLTPPKIDKLRVIKSDGKLYRVASQEHNQLDADISFWNIKRKQYNKKMFDSESLLMKLLPFIPHIITGFLVIIILYILLDSLPSILGELTRLTSELRSLKGADVVTHNLIWPLLT